MKTFPSAHHTMVLDYHASSGDEWAAPFSEADLEQVRQWRPIRRRIIVLSLSLLWHKAPTSEWQAWLIEANASSDIPPDDFDRARISMFGALAEALQITNNLVSQDWRRGHKWLYELDYVKGLQDDA